MYIFHYEMCTFHVMMMHSHDEMLIFHDGDIHIHDANNMRCACFVQTMQDIAQVWMDTAGKVTCDNKICRKHGAKEAKESLYCRDPEYVQKTGTGNEAHKGSSLYSNLISMDWGVDASNMRDDDMKLVGRMFQGLFRGDMANAPNLFHTKKAIFTSAETTNILGLSTMSENALKIFKGGWLHWRKDDDIRSLLDEDPAVYAGLDRLANNKDYSPYGRSETRQEATGGKTMRMDDRDRAGSADTLPDNCEYDGPSLGA